MPQPAVYIALGSNLGDSRKIILEALERLGKISIEPIRASQIWISDPVHCPPGSPPFRNAVACIVPGSQENPESLFGKLQALEKEFGRIPKRIMNEPRPLDLDLIAWGDLALRSPRLILPHPRAHTRRFVLGPLAEIAPSLILPGQQLPVSELLARLPSAESAFPEVRVA